MNGKFSVSLLVTCALIIINGAATTNARKMSKKESELSISKFLDSHSSTQITNLHLLSRKMLKRMQTQSEQNTESLSKCYEQLGKYTRLNNKRRALQNNEKTISLNSENDEEEFRVKNVNSDNEKETQTSFTLLKELNFYLAELERNYKIIQELRAKIDTMSKSNSASYGYAPSGAFVANLTQNRTEGDCSIITGTGYLHIDVPTDEAKNKKRTNEQVRKQSVLCENQWLVIQQRQNGFETNFNRTWREYREGFGSLRTDFWLGLELVSRLTQRKSHRLLIELTDWSDQVFYAQYEHFEVGDDKDNFRLTLTERYTGNASKDFLDDIYYGFLSQNGAFFSTYDNYNKFKTNNLTSSKGQQQMKNCALRSGGGWWFNNFSNCLPVNLNGIYVTGASAPSARGIKWQAIRVQDRNYSLKKAKMKIKANH